MKIVVKILAICNVIISALIVLYLIKEIASVHESSKGFLLLFIDISGVLYVFSCIGLLNFFKNPKWMFCVLFVLCFLPFFIFDNNVLLIISLGASVIFFFIKKMKVVVIEIMTLVSCLLTLLWLLLINV
jgi:hypothetical protein